MCLNVKDSLCTLAGIHLFHNFLTWFRNDFFSQSSYLWSINSFLLKSLLSTFVAPLPFPLPPTSSLPSTSTSRLANPRDGLGLGTLRYIMQLSMLCPRGGGTRDCVGTLIAFSIPRVGICANFEIASSPRVGNFDQMQRRAVLVASHMN